MIVESWDLPTPNYPVAAGEYAAKSKIESKMEVSSDSLRTGWES